MSPNNEHHILLFDGLGSSSAIADMAAAVKSNAVKNPHSCSAIFLRESRVLFSALLEHISQDDLDFLCLTRIQLDNACTAIPSSDTQELKSPFIAMTTLYIVQVCALLGTLERDPSNHLFRSLSCTSSAIDIIGYSSGIIPAILTASISSADLSISSLLHNAVELYPLLFFIAFRCLMYREGVFRDLGLEKHDPVRERPWSLVVWDIGKRDLEDRIKEFNDKNVKSKIHLTAFTTSTCYTVSGHPTTLASFQSTHLHPHLPSTSCSSKFADIFTMYHSPDPDLRLQQVKEAIMADYNNYECSVGTRHIAPKRPIWSTMTGEEIDFIASPSIGIGNDETTFSRGIIEHMLDTILLRPVDFSGTVSKLSEAIRKEQSRSRPLSLKISILNAGPGSSLSRILSRTLRSNLHGTELCGGGVAIEVQDMVDLLYPASSSTMPTCCSGLADGHESGNNPIAIVGMAFDLPGAKDSVELWDLLVRGRNMVSEIPLSRFDTSPYRGPSPSSSTTISHDQIRSLKTRYGNFISDSSAQGFDHAFFRISPREAKSMDPQQRLLMKIAFEALEDAGYTAMYNNGFEKELEGERLRRERTGCYVGIATGDYAMNLRGEIGVHYITGTLPAFHSGRISYALGLGGPSVVINTACSSSMAAIHQACRAIQAGDCESAVAGGVNIIAGPDMFMGLDKAHFLSPTGQCKPFSEAADGYCRAEGCVMFVLKRLSDALRERDHIHAVIRGVEMNQSAEPGEHSITHPHVPTQVRLFQSLLESSGVAPSEVGVVEAHGTGTQAGDVCEMESIRRVLCPSGGGGRTSTNALHLTSIKANIGHSEAASGAASLAKAILMFRYGIIPPQISIFSDDSGAGNTGLNKKISAEDLEKDYVRIDTEAVDWERRGGKRMAMINNFGASGNNVAVIVEEPSVMEADPGDGAEQILVAFSGETEEALMNLRDKYISYLSAMMQRREFNPLAISSFLDFAYTITARRQIRPWRVSLVVDLSSLKYPASIDSTLKAILDAQPVYVEPSIMNRGKVVFVFSGQGRLQLGMGRSMYETSAYFKKIVDSCHEKLVFWGYPGVLNVINSRSVSLDNVVKDGDNDSEPKILISLHCALFCIQYALVRVVASWGILPNAVIGHSLGEYAALVTADVISLDAGLRLVAYRARLIAHKCKMKTTGMLAVQMPSKDSLDQFVQGLNGHGSLTIACYNTASNAVVGGPLDELSALKERLTGGTTACKCIDLDVPVAYHTNAMLAIAQDFASYAEKFEFGAPRVPIVSNVLGRLVRPGEKSVFTAKYLVDHCLQPVLFQSGIDNLLSEVALASENSSRDIWLEFGPHPTISPMVSDINVETSICNVPMLSTLHGRYSARKSLTMTLSRLYTSGIIVDWRAVYHELYPSVRCVEAPTYPFAETRYWVPYREEIIMLPAATKFALPSPHMRFAFLSGGSWTRRPTQSEFTSDFVTSEFEISIEKLKQWIMGHQVSSFALCPASVYHELVLEATTCTMSELDSISSSDLITLMDVEFKQPLVYTSETPLTIRTALNLNLQAVKTKYAGSFTVSSIRCGDGLEVIHCTGFIKKKDRQSAISSLQLCSGDLERRRRSLLQGDGDRIPETYHTRTIYDIVFPRIVRYSKTYQVVQSMTISDTGEEAIAAIRLSYTHDLHSGSSFAVDPVFVDALIHVPGFLINCTEATQPYDKGDVYICVDVGSVRIRADLLIDSGKLPCYDVHCSIFQLEDGHVVADSWAVESNSMSKSPNVVARAKRMRFARLRLTSLHKLLSRTGSAARTVLKPKLTIIPPKHKNVLNSAVSGSNHDAARSVHPMSPATTTTTTFAGGSAPPSPSTEFDVESRLIKLVADVCEVPISHVQSESRLADLGIDSLMWIELVGRLKTLAPEVKISLGMMPPQHIRDLAETVREATGVTSLTHRSSDAQLPLTAAWVHTLKHGRNQDDLSTDSISYMSHNALDKSETVLASSFAATEVFTDPTHGSIVPLATSCLSQIQHSLSGSSSTAFPPLVLIHDGSGASSYYTRISSLGRDVWTIQNPNIFTGNAFEGGIDGMARFYAELLLREVVGLRENGCVLGGWSFGGVAAFHMAILLQQKGIDVKGIILIDSPSPFTDQVLPDALIDAVLSKTRRNSVVYGDEQQAQGKGLKMIELAKIQMKHSSQALVSYVPPQLPSPESGAYYPKLIMIRCTSSFPSVMNGDSLWDRVPFLGDRDDSRTMVKDWENLVGHEIPVLDVPGHHFEVFEGTNVQVLSDKIVKALAMLKQRDQLRS